MIFFGGGRVEVVTQEKLSKYRVKVYEADYHWTFEYRRGTNGFMDDSGRWMDTNNGFWFNLFRGRWWNNGKLAKGYVSAGYTATSLLPEAEAAETMMTWISFGGPLQCDLPKAPPNGTYRHTRILYGRLVGWLWLHVFFLSKGHTFLVSKGVYCLIRSKRVPCLENPTTIPPPSTLPQAKRGLMTSEFLKFSCKSQPQKRRQLSYKFTTPTWNKEREREYLHVLAAVVKKTSKEHFKKNSPCCRATTGIHEIGPQQGQSGSLILYVVISPRGFALTD